MNLHPDDFATVVVTTIRKSLDGPLVAGRFATIEARILQLEARPVPVYRGTYEESKGYPANCLVTYASTLWRSMMPTSSAPGSDPSWQLAVKKGDAR